MSEYIISDTHFFHPLMKKYRRIDYNETIIQYLFDLNSLADKEQLTIFHLGDLGWHETDKIENIIQSLNDKINIVLIKGNHDKQLNSKYYRTGFDCVCDQLMLSKYGYNIYLSHKPIKLYNDSDINIHGHFHNIRIQDLAKYEQDLIDLLTDNHYLISAETEKYRPVKLQTLIQNIERKKIKPTLEKIKEPGRTKSDTHGRK